MFVAFCIRGLQAQAQQAKPTDPATQASNPVTSELSPSQIQSRLKKAEESKDLPEAVRTALLDTYKKILTQLKAADEFSTKGDEFVKGAQEAPVLLRQARVELETPAEPPPTIDDKMPLAEMHRSLSLAEAKLAELQKKLNDIQFEPKRRADRRVEIPKLQELIRKQQADLELQQAVKPPADENAEVTVANRLLLDARKQATSRELMSYEQELRFYEATTELLTARRDLAVVQVAQAEQAVKSLRTAVNDRRKGEAEQQARDARTTALQAHPAIKQLARDNATLTTDRQVLAGKIERVARESDACEKSLAELDAEFAKVMDRVKRVGLTQAIGLLLRKQRDSLPNVESHRRDTEKRQAEISKVSLDLVELEDQRATLAEVDARTDLIVNQLKDSVDSLELPLIQEDIRILLQTKRGYLDSLIADTNSYLDKLVEYDTRDRQLIRKARDYASFCNEYILWIHSTDLLQPSDRQYVVQALKWLTNPSSWTDVGNVLWNDVTSNPIMYFLGLVLLLILVTSHRTWKRLLINAGQEANKSFATTFRPTAEALVLTLLISLTWPAVMWGLGHRLDRLADREFVAAFGRTLQFLASLSLTVELARHVCASGGLGEAHFGWPQATVRQCRRSLRLLLIIGFPIGFVVLMTETQMTENYRRSLGRICFLVGQLLLAFFAHRIWQATEGMARERASRAVWIWAPNVRRIWYVATVGAPLSLAVLAFLGFYYTATQLEWRLIATFRLTFGLAVAHATLMRGLLMAYRDLAIRRARERRAAESTAAAAGSTVPGAEVSIVPESTFKLADVNEQTRKLLRIAIVVAFFVGMCLIWVEVLPALRVLHRVELWPHPFTIMEAVSMGNIPPGILTLADVILAFLTAMVTIVATRNIPGLLEITVLRQLTLDAGARYAITAVSRYLLTLLGVLLIIGQLGIAWSNIQWLIAGISVGLGFGLQEIFANFVSGLILLFERPIRIGDVVSVADVTGKVTRIRIRATTITDWDMRELVVPNKEFITARVMNWTLSDTLARMTVKVGVAFGSDPNLVRKLLLEVAEKNPNVLKDPPPHALFDEFGDSTLRFTLRVYLPSLDVFLQVRHELHSDIASAFKTAGVEIAYPQQDIHIRSAVEPVSNSGNGPFETPASVEAPDKNG